MKNKESVNWSFLLDSNATVANEFRLWSTEEMSTRELSTKLSHSQYAGEFRKLVRNRGTTEARKLARKALRYRGCSI